MYSHSGCWKDSLGVDGDLNDQLGSSGKGDIWLKEFTLGDQMLVWGKKLTGVPVITEEDCIHQVSNGLGDHSKFGKGEGETIAEMDVL